MHVNGLTVIVYLSVYFVYENVGLRAALSQLLPALCDKAHTLFIICCFIGRFILFHFRSLQAVSIAHANLCYVIIVTVASGRFAVVQQTLQYR